MPIEPIDEQESFLVEARSIGGYSGSPVFIYIPILSYRENVEDWYAPITTRDPITGYERLNESLAAFAGKDWGHFKSHGPWLLGVDWGHINDWQPVCGAAGTPIDRGGPPWKTQVRMNTGIMTVVPAWKLIEMVDAGSIADQRKQIVENIRKHQESNPPPVTPD
jgi:hypothetical protein